MSKLNNIRSFFVSRICGLIFIIISIFLFTSLFGFNKNDVALGNYNSSLITLNYLGPYGSYISGFLIVALHYSSYLIPIFFLIIGIK